MRRIISILLQNEAGALARVAGMFSARGYNIDSLSVAATHDASISRLTLVTFGNDAVIDQIIKQSRKLIEVIEIADLTGRDHFEIELVLVKLDVATDALNPFVACLRRQPRAQVIDISAGVRTIEFTGDGAEVNAFLADLGQVGRVLELARSGSAALERGAVTTAAAIA
ncbi:MAG TPA: acetolactate synthase small subunit [Rudaea sp.]|jgi:acetolactate synthase-1/3 small subunit|uniref:acetolactate synthase small subunit n=1 Tax=Rudaea sp. TaxID=2136325 RepID=UPI002F93B690